MIASDPTARCSRGVDSERDKIAMGRPDNASNRRICRIGVGDTVVHVRCDQDGCSRRRDVGALTVNVDGGWGLKREARCRRACGSLDPRR